MKIKSTKIENYLAIKCNHYRGVVSGKRSFYEHCMCKEMLLEAISQNIAKIPRAIQYVLL